MYTQCLVASTLCAATAVASVSHASVIVEQPQVIYSQATTIYGADMAVKSDGSVGFVYSDTSAFAVRYLELGSSAVAVPATHFNNFAPALTYGLSDEAHVTYWKVGVNELQYTYQVAGAWQPVTSIGTTGIGNAEMVVDPDGNLHVAWMRNTVTGARGRYYRMRDSAGNWQAERIPVDSSTTLYATGGANVLARNASDVYLFGQSHLNHTTNTGPAAVSPFVFTKTDSGDFQIKQVPPQTYDTHRGGINSYESSVMDAAFRGPEVDLAAIQRWGGSGTTGFVNLYLDVTGSGTREPTVVYDDEARDASEVSMVIGSDGMHYVFYVAPHADAGIESLFLQMVDAAGVLVGDRLAITDGSAAVSQIDTEWSDGIIHVMYLADQNSLNYAQVLVPEPGSLMVMSAASAVLLARRRRRL